MTTLNQKEILQDFIINNVPHKIDNIEIVFGEKQNNVMFNTRLNLQNKNNYDIVPIINCMLSTYFINNNNPFTINYISNYYFENYCYNIKQQSYKDKEISYYNEKLINYNLIENVCLKAKSKHYKKPIYFTSMKTYNHKEIDLPVVLRQIIQALFF